MSTASPRIYRIPRKPAPSIDPELALSIPLLCSLKSKTGEDDYSPNSLIFSTPIAASTSDFESCFLSSHRSGAPILVKTPPSATTKSSISFISKDVVTGNYPHHLIDGNTTPGQQIKETLTKSTGTDTSSIFIPWDEVDATLATLSTSPSTERPNSFASSMVINSDTVSFDRDFSLPPLSFNRHHSQSDDSLGSEFPRSAWSDDSSLSEPRVRRHRPITAYPPQPAPFAWTPLPSKFHENTLPSVDDLQLAHSMDVISEDGRLVRFGDLWENQKTVVIFIRHFWCPMCQDYMFSISSHVSAAVLADAKVKLIIVSNGSYEMIKSYRSIFRTPFAVYTDPTLRVYTALGMTMKSLEKGTDSDCGMYIRHGFMAGVGMVVKNALKAGMPFWVNGGDVSQLGGEFVLGPGLQCSYAHRMSTTRSHVPILVILQEAGVDMFTPLQRNRSFSGRSFLPMTDQELDAWRSRRKDHLSMIKDKRVARRGGPQWCLPSTHSLSTASVASAKSVATHRQMPTGLVSSSCVSVAAISASESSSSPYMVRDASTSTTELDDSSSEYLSIYSRSSRGYVSSRARENDDDGSIHSIERSIFMESILNMVSVGHNTISPQDVLKGPTSQKTQAQLRRNTTSKVEFKSPKKPRCREDTFFTGAGLFMTW